MHESRRHFLKSALVGSAGVYGLSYAGLPEDASKTVELAADLKAVGDRSASAPVAPVALERCRSYDREKLAASLKKLFDSIGGLPVLMRGKTVTMKLNITGDGNKKMARLPAERTYQTHPAMVEVLCGLFRRAGAKRIVLVESYYKDRSPEEIIARHGWDPEKIKSAADGRVVFADTRNRGTFKDYAEIEVPYGGYVFDRYYVNRHYVDTDVFVSLAKLKNHVTAGVTCAVKNLFGMAPTALYGNDAPNERTTENRGALLHSATREPPDGLPRDRFALPEGIAGNRPKTAAYRVPRVTADLFAARPIDLAIVDGIESVSGGEGPWCPPPHAHTTPGLLIAGTNGVNTDAVCTAVMGYDPRARYEAHPFPGENHLELLARGGVGSNDLSRVETRGVELVEALTKYHPKHPGKGWIERKRDSRG